MMIIEVFFRTEGMFDKHDPKEKDFELWKRIAKYINGKMAYVVSTTYEGEEKFIYLGLRNDADDKEAVYLMEQDSMTGCYINDREGFEEAWKSANYVKHGLFYIPKDKIIFPWQDPRKLVIEGIEVPFQFIINWYCTYGCNNWRKHKGLLTLRECGYRKRRRK